MRNTINDPSGSPEIMDDDAVTTDEEAEARFNHEIDKTFVRYFRGRLKQVFIYATDDCQLRCRHCLYKPDLTFHMRRKEIEVREAIRLIDDFRKLGASKLTIMGGEPALYGTPDHAQLEQMIDAALQMGYEYVRMDTNGQFEDDFLAHEGMKKLHEVSFSLDGYDAGTHESLRGYGTFKKCVKNIKRAIELGHNVDVTVCVHKGLTQRDEQGELRLDKMIRFIESLGVKRINFHVLLKHGFPMDTWSEDTDLQVDEWVSIHKEISSNIQSGKYKIEVRLPLHFVRKEEFEKNPEYFGYCAAKLGERLLVHPNGQMRICSGLISSAYAVGTWNKRKIRWNDTGTNELLDHKMCVHSPCTNQSKSMATGDYVPLCFSFKPGQSETVYRNILEWDKRRNDGTGEGNER